MDCRIQENVNYFLKDKIVFLSNVFGEILEEMVYFHMCLVIFLLS